MSCVKAPCFLPPMPSPVKGFHKEELINCMCVCVCVFVCVYMYVFGCAFVYLLVSSPSSPANKIMGLLCDKIISL